MADYDIIPYDEELFQDRNENVTDLHAYYMSQFNLELENCNKTKPKDSFKFGIEESFDFEVLNSWDNTANANADFEMIDQVIDSNIDEQNIKEVLLDLDSIEFDTKNFKAETTENCNKKLETNYYVPNNDYIDDESLIDELCREDGESCRLTPDFNDEYLATNSEKSTLPSIETAFSKRYCNYNKIENNQQIIYNKDNQIQNQQCNNLTSLEHYSYPNNVLYNLDCNKSYILPDTPTSVTEFNFDRNRKVSVSESVDSDVQSSSYYDENSTFDDDELFINLDDYGLNLERDELGPENNRNVNQTERKADKEKAHGKTLFVRAKKMHWILHI